jgi:uncharacterized delta-60 repeat protein/uncharacterized repeat protein (TIGR01451 family)
MSDRDTSPYFAAFNRSLRLRRVFFIAFGVVGLFLVLAALALAAPGDLDPSFGNDGVINSGFSVNALAIQPDGKIVVSGDAVARYNPDGTLDFTFGNNGVVATSPAITAMTLQSDGKIVVAGQRTMIRLNSNGSLDTSFGGTGIVTTDISIREITDVALTANNRLVIFGETATDGIAVARYTSTGNRDLSFNSTGEVNTGLMKFVYPGPNGTALPQPDGKLVVVGTVYGSWSSIELIRYNANGSLDNNFGVNGRVVTTSSDGVSGQGAVQQPDGKIVVWGIGGGICLVRFDTQGNFDPTFGIGGISKWDAFSSVGWLGTLKAATLQRDGKIIILETMNALARFLPNGQPDLSFGIAGVVADSRLFAHSLALQGDKLIVGGDDYLARRHLLGLLFSEQTVSSTSPDPGQLITYTFTLKNTEALTIMHIAISDTLPTELSWAGPLGIEPPISVTLGQPPAVVQDLTLPPGQGITLTLPMTVNLSTALGTPITHTLIVASDQTGLLTSSLVITTAGPPIAQNDLALTGKNMPVVVYVLNNDWDPNNDAVSLINVGTPLSGTTSLSGITVPYTPTLDFVGTDTFTYTVSDGRFDTAGTVTVIVANQLFKLYYPVVLGKLGPMP